MYMHHAVCLVHMQEKLNLLRNPKVVSSEPMNKSKIHLYVIVSHVQFHRHVTLGDSFMYHKNILAGIFEGETFINFKHYLRIFSPQNFEHAAPTGLAFRVNVSP